MTIKPDGGAAFPTGLTPGHYSQEGMSYRDYAMIHLMAGAMVHVRQMANATNRAEQIGLLVSICDEAVDAMIAERCAQ